MRIVVVVVLVSFLAIPAVHGAGKKTKDIPTQICERGELIFEDDFSGKEINWTLDDAKEEGNKYKIAKRALVITSSSPERHWALIRRVLPEPSRRVIVQFTVTPQDRTLFFIQVQTEGSQIRGWVDLGASVCSLRKEDSAEGKSETFALTQLPRSNAKSHTVLCELLDGQVCLTVLGRSSQHDFGDAIQAMRSVMLDFYIDSSLGVALNDVKVWKALPKDHADGKEKNK